LGKPELAGNYLNLQSPVWPRLYIHRVLPTVPPTYNNHHSMSEGVLKQKFIQAGCPSCGPTYSVHSKHVRHTHSCRRTICSSKRRADVMAAILKVWRHIKSQSFSIVAINWRTILPNFIPVRF